MLNIQLASEEWVDGKLSGGTGESFWELIPSITGKTIKYGRLYNWYAATDSRGIAPIGWHIATVAECQTLNEANGFPILLSGGIYGGQYNYPFEFAGINSLERIMTTEWDGSYIKYVYYYVNNTFYVGNSGGVDSLKFGSYIKLIKNDSNNEGDVIIDGDTYHSVTIGSQVWLQQNLAVRHYQNGDPIGSDFSGTFGAVCSYNDDENNVYDITTTDDLTHIRPTLDRKIYASDIDNLPTGGGSSVTDVTYNELSELINDSGLTIGSQYLITDYQTVHAIPNTSDINTGIIEPLLVTASGLNTLKPESYSSLFPQDIIYYEVSNDPKIVDSMAMTKVIDGSTMGYIYRRIDTFQNNDIPFDFRNVKFRRWQIDVTSNTWENSTSYNKNSVVLYPNSNNIYICLNDNVTGIDPSSDNENSWKLFEWTNLSYVSPVNNSWSLSNFSINCSTGYTDYNMWINWGYNGYISSYSNKINSMANRNNISYSNSIFYGSSSNNDIYAEFSNNSIKNNFRNNIIIDVFYNNSIGSDFTNNNTYGDFGRNSISNGFHNNSSGDDFYGNIILDGFNSNEINGNYFTNNIIRNSFNNNVMGDNCHDNNIGKYFQYNNTGINFYNNKTGDSFQNNIIGSSFNYNIILGDFRDNLIVNGFQSNKIGNSFASNDIKNYFQYNNSIGDNFNSNIINGVFNNNSIGDNFNNNILKIYFSNCTIGNNFSKNTTGYNFYQNNIGDNFNQNTIESDFKYNTVGSGFIMNNVFDNFNFDYTGVDFSLSTHVYNSYNKELYIDSSGNKKLIYDKMIIVDANA